MTKVIAADVVGKKVYKKSGKPFKSTFKLNTVKGVIPHPFSDKAAYVFEEDDSYVSAEQCTIVLSE